MFYKLDNGGLLSGKFITTPTKTLTEPTDAPHDGWFWFDTVEQAQVLTTTNNLSSISMRQARLELLNRNLLDSVDAMISQMPRAAQIEWEYATEIQRDNPLVTQLANALNLSPADMDEFYHVAATL